jgi:hypothetical protein
VTREQIVDGLAILAAALPDYSADMPAGWHPHEWSYVLGIAGGELLRLRDRLAADVLIRVPEQQRPPAGLG